MRLVHSAVMHVSLDGKVAVVTGGGRGIGAATARELARRGARVVVNDIGVSVEGRPEDESVALGVVKDIEADGGVAVADQSDVSTYEGAGSVVNAAIEAWGQIDILVNSAGTLRIRPIWELDQDDWDEVMN